MSQESYVTKGNAMKDPRQFFLCPLYLKSYRVTKDSLYVTGVMGDKQNFYVPPLVTITLSTEYPWALQFYVIVGLKIILKIFGF